MDKSLIIRLFNNKFLFNYIFIDCFKYIHSLIFSNKLNSKTYRWHELINNTEVIAGNGYLDLLHQYFERNNNNNSNCDNICSSKTIINAIKFGSLRMLRYLMEEVKIDVLRKDKLLNYHNDVLRYAVRYSKFDIIRYLCEESVVATKLNFNQAMIEAPFSHSMDILKYIMERDSKTAKFSSTIEYTRLTVSPFDTAAKVGRVDMIDYLATNRSSDRKYSMMYHNAIIAGHDNVVEYLLRENKDVTSFNEDDEVDNLFGLAARENNFNVLQMLYNHNIVTNPEEAIEGAAENGNIEMLNWINVRIPSCPVGSAINKASCKGHLKAIEWLFENKSDQIASQNPFAQTNPIVDAAIFGNLSIIQWFHWNQHHHFQFNSNVMHSAALNGFTEIVAWLHQNRTEGCNSNTFDITVKNEHFDVLKYLHTHRITSATDKAMNYAIERNRMDILIWLHENRSEGCSTLGMDIAARDGNLPVAQWLHNNRTEGCSRMTLHLAVKYGKLDMAEWLMANKTECTIQSISYNDHLTPILSNIIRNDDYRAMEWLLKRIPAEGIEHYKHWEPKPHASNNTAKLMRSFNPNNK
ncbi:hypothetical protein PPL_05625 [Heterostelium album PN500]|uniref:Ankyrin repeat protein n=1 Tax=Heterostelium pallidum (strain ATCC 26659 / Pp 5 / PN500) TaxID=670386 RepID=D3BAP6_HETP5|nr:hypothetical protein PPL_05625 [Heterostelium album PN500]EFA81633.1 hypothetical protein PPL_05625 [Heterostelium album PN500]|eukprot:XP_020433750.1 hypothetical protein PPL_05625 [Heterostelium album PN500]